jgi:hypothetical protein
MPPCKVLAVSTMSSTRTTRDVADVFITSETFPSACVDDRQIGVEALRDRPRTHDAAYVGRTTSRLS